MHSVMDTWALDFVANRLPPFPPERSLFHIPDPAFGPNAPADQRIVSRSALMSASGIPLSSAAFAAHKLSFHKYPLRLRSAHLLRMRETEEAVILHHPFHNSRRFVSSSLFVKFSLVVVLPAAVDGSAYLLDGIWAVACPKPPKTLKTM